jgi:hypothetical protein
MKNISDKCGKTQQREKRRNEGPKGKNRRKN